MKPSDARRLLLGQHEHLRLLVGLVEKLGARLLAGESVGERFREALGDLRKTFAAHNVSETELLEPMLRSADEWGPLRVARMTEEHLAEHAALRELLHGDERDVARRIPDFAEELLAHMDAEERTVLSVGVLRDEIVRR
jgi:hemerythrin superfamily protein